MTSIDKEMQDSNDRLSELCLHLKNLNEKKKTASDNDLEILMDEIILLEISIESEKVRYYNLQQFREYQLSCDHTFVDDLIDISPDKSKVVKYCSNCLFTCEN
jgi:hypothetical protein